jgi:hypothetical protein
MIFEFDRNRAREAGVRINTRQGDAIKRSKTLIHRMRTSVESKRCLVEQDQFCACALESPTVLVHLCRKGYQATPSAGLTVF